MCSDPNATEEANFQASATMAQTLQADFGSAFAHNQAILGNLTTALNQAVAKPMGFTSAQQAALRTGAMDTTTQQFNAAKSAAGAAAARYGGDVASGVTGQIEGSLAGQEAETESGQQNQITEANAELQQQNYWKGIQGLSNVASEYNPTGYAGATTSAENATTGAANAVQSESEQSWQNTFGVISGISGLASAAAGMPTGGAGGVGVSNGAGPAADWGDADAGSGWTMPEAN
jgi:hypothetical protein